MVSPTLILCSLLAFHIKESCTKECQENKCGAGYQEVECSVDGEKNRCLQNPHCTPESTIELVENALVCVCDTSKSYWGENYLDCKKREPPCPLSKSLDRKSGECICKTDFIEMDGICVKQAEHPATPGTNLDTDGQGSSSNSSVIAGSTIGAVVLLFIIIVVACYLRRKMSNNRSSHISSDPEADVNEPLKEVIDDLAPNGTGAHGPSESAPADSPNVTVVNYNITAENVQIGDNNRISNGHAVQEQ